MRANIVKGFYLLNFILFFNIQLNSQVSINSGLNPNGEIYDVAVDSNNDLYIVVGNFSQINGVPANNIAFINRSTMTVNTTYTSSITGINGVINCVEYKRVNVSQTTLGWTDYIFLGGTFTTGGGINNCFFMRLKKTVNDPTYSKINENLGFNATLEPNQVVKDLVLKNDTLICIGNFTYNSPYTTQNAIKNILAFKISYGVSSTQSNPPLDRITTMFNSSNYSGVDIQYLDFQKCILHHNNYYCSAFYTYNNPDEQMVCKFDEFGNFITFIKAGLPINDFKYGFTKLNIGDTLLISSGYYSGNIDSIKSNYFHFDGSNYVDANCSNTDPFFRFDSICTSTKTFSGPLQYQNKVYIIKHGTFNYSMSLARFDFDESPTPPLKTVAEIITPPSSPLPNAPLLPVHFNNTHLNRADNLLFIYNQDFAEVLTDGGSDVAPVYSHGISKLAVFCLEPQDFTNYSLFDSLVCPGDTALYVLPQLKYADGFVIEYTGTGVDVFADDLGNEDLKDTLLGGYNFSLHILDNFTPGDLKVIPFSTCNGLTINGFYSFGKPYLKHIDYFNQPNIYVTDDTTLNCIRDSVNLHGYSDSINVSYHWQNSLGMIGTIGQDTLCTTNDFGISTPTTLNFIFQVTDTITRCYNTDTVKVFLDTIKPDLTLPTTGTYDITCDVDTVLVPFSSTNSSVGYFWSNGADTTYNDTISAPVFGSYYAYVKDSLNGCIKQEAFYVGQNTTPPPAGLVGYATVPTITPIDTITCYVDTLSYICMSDSSFTISQWLDDVGNLTGNDTIIITNGGNYTFNIKDTINGCITEKTIIVNEFTTLPSVTLAPVQILNCSVDSVVLSANTITLDTSFLWIDALGNSYTSNQITTGTAGWHFLTVTRNDNGCSYIDSVEVTYAPIIDLIVSDTLICDSTSVDLTVGYIGNLSNVNYLWDNGMSTQNATYNSTTDTLAIINVIADSGCTGTDTITINTPQAVQTNILSYAPCNDWNSGQLVVNVTDGLYPYTYSLDNGSFQNYSVFQNLTTGNYIITVKDSLGCTYNFSTEVTPDDLVPTPEFIFSTYNVQSDTVVLVNISSPPTDSVQWIFPNEINLLEDANTNAPVIILPDTGAFEITMIGYFGSCNFSQTKWIYSSEFDTTLANYYNQNGIKSVELYPNPNTGIFTVEIEFYKKQNSVTIVQDMNGFTYYYKENDQNSEIVTHQIDLGSTIVPGTYVLKVASEFDSYYVTFIVSN